MRSDIDGIGLIIALVIFVGRIVYEMIYKDMLASDKKKVEEYEKFRKAANQEKKDIETNKTVVIDGQEVEIEDLIEAQNEYFDSLPDEAVRRYHYPKELAPNGIQIQNLSDYQKSKYEKYKKEALICSVCGAPLKRVYAKCAHCGTRHLPK